MKYFIFILTFISVFSFARTRTHYVNESMYIASYSNIAASEASIVFWNPSQSDQIIDVSNLNLEIISSFYNQSSGGLAQTFINNFTVTLSNPFRPMNGGDPINEIQAEPVAGANTKFTITPGNFTQIIIDLSPKIANSYTTPYFQYSLTSYNFWMGFFMTRVYLDGEQFGVAPNIGTLALTGFITVTDADTKAQGYLLGTGAIMRPFSRVGKSGEATLNFSFNNRKPL